MVEKFEGEIENMAKDEDSCEACRIFFDDEEKKESEKKYSRPFDNPNYVFKDNPRRNKSYCSDPTCHDAIENLSRSGKDDERFYTFLKTIFSICKLSGFYIENRLEVMDTRTGKHYK